jgi:hypothetical protein
MNYWGLAGCVLCHCALAGMLVKVARDIRWDVAGMASQAILIRVYIPGTKVLSAGERLRWAARYELIAAAILVFTVFFAFHGYRFIRDNRDRCWFFLPVRQQLEWEETVRKYFPPTGTKKHGAHCQVHRPARPV